MQTGLAGFRHAGLHYLRLGLAILRRSPWLYVAVLATFAMPAALAAALTVSDLPDGFGRTALLWSLNAVSAAVAPPVVMLMVAAGHRRRPRRFLPAIAAGLRWFPRYLWTNLHTTVIFWVPVSAALWLFSWQQRTFPLDGAAETAATVLWVMAIATLGLYLHTRTLLAPFLAVHANLPGTLAALESWRLSGRHFARVFGAFIIPSAPVAVPLGLLILAGWLALGDTPARREALLAMWPSLTWVFIKFVRPLLIAAVYCLHHDLQQESAAAPPPRPPLPWLARPLLRLSALIPRLLARVLRRRTDWTL
jgi:hypothetical protein